MFVEKICFHVGGMSCGGCEKRIENALSKMESVSEVHANHESGEVVVSVSSLEVKDALAQKIEDLGYEVQK